MKVLIADDHAVFRRGLRETLAEAFSRVTFGEARTAQETLEQVRRQDWDVVILLISMHPEQQFARRALKSGAAGYLTKDSVTDELKEAVKKIVGGGRYVSAALAEKLAVDLRQGADTPLYELLSDREFQVLRMIASGTTVKDIAADLSLSVKRLSTYRGRILEKTGMKTNAEMTRYALDSQL